MQQLIEYPRNTLTNAQVLQAIQYSSHVDIDAGLDLLDATSTFVADVSPALLVDTASVTRDNTAMIPGGFSGTLEPAQATVNGAPWVPAWGLDRIRPWMTMDAKTGLGPIRFNLGVFLATTPGQALNEDAPSAVQYAVTGYDKMYLLTNEVGDSYSVAAGTNIATAVQTVLTAAAYYDSLALLENNGSTTATDMVWPLTSDHQYTYLDVINDLVAAGGYAPLWVDQNGAYRLQAFIAPGSRQSELYLAAGATASAIALYGSAALAVAQGIVAYEGRAVTLDTWNVPNYWRFVQNGLTFVPVEGGGLYTVANYGDGPTSQFAVQRTIRTTQYLDAASQAALVTQGDAIVAAAKAGAEQYTLNTGPIPIAGNYDIVTYSDTQLPVDKKLMALQYTLPLNGDDMSWTFRKVA